MGTLLHDLRYALRLLLARKGFTAIALGVLALGIGGSSAMFSVVNTVLLRPLHFPEPERLLFVWEHSQRIGRFPVSVPNFVDWRAQAQSFEHLGAFVRTTFNLTGGAEPERLDGMVVTSGFLETLGVPPLLGRTFTRDEERPRAGRVAILGEALWRSRFGADPDVIGKPILLGGEAYSIVGVMPAETTISRQAELWTPMALDPSEFGRGAHFLVAAGRLKPGVTQQAAEAEMKGLARQLEQQYPETNTGWSVELVPMLEQFVSRVRPALLILFGAVGFVLLIACANVANLLLARATSRHKEIAVRMALGAGRRRLVRQLLTESLVLSVLGGLLGLGLAAWGLDLLVSLGPETLPRRAELGLDLRVMLFTLGLSLLTGTLFGLAPALQTSRPELSEELKEGGGKTTEGRRPHRFRNGLMAAEVGVALVLLIGAGLLIKSFALLLRTDPGFEERGLVTLKLALPEAKYKEAPQRAELFRGLQQEIAALPGVEAVGAVDGLPFDGRGNLLVYLIEGRPEPPPGQGQNSAIHGVGAGYLQAMGIELVRGRNFTEEEAWSESDVVLINQTMARRNWPDEDPIGKRLTFGDSNGPWLTVIGLVRDVRHSSLEQEPGPETYLPYQRFATDQMAYAVRTSLPPSGLVGPIRERIRRLDADLPVFDVSTMQQIRSESLAQERFQLTLLSLFAAVALGLAAVGLYGVMAYSVTERTREVGIRMALGARPEDVLRMLLGQGFRLVLVGLGLGVLGALGLTRVLQHSLYGISATDPAVFAAVALLLCAVALLAVYIPARRATRVDPMVALRYE
jgi:putative ABC transport system permease protein